MTDERRTSLTAVPVSFGPSLIADTMAFRSRGRGFTCVRQSPRLQSKMSDHHQSSAHADHPSNSLIGRLFLRAWPAFSTPFRVRFFSTES